MRSRQKGFDPLSSLFESADLPLGTPLPAVDDGPEPPRSRRAGHVELTDPLFKTPPDLHGPASAQQGPPAPAQRALRTDFPVTVGPSPEAMAEEPNGPPASEEPEEAPARRAVSASEKAAIAKAVAKAAARKTAPPPPKAPQPPKAAPRPLEKAAPKPAEKKGWEGNRNPSRLDSLSVRARRPVSAAEAARVAVEAEEAERKAHALPPAASPTTAAKTPAAPETAADLTDLVQALIPKALPNVGPIYVANAMVTDQRDVLAMLWKSHRTKFTGDGQLERAVGAAAVLHALQTVAQGQLVAAHVVTDASDYLVWLDLGSGSLVAAFADARAYFAAST